MPEEPVVTACPECKRLVQAKDYLRHPLGSVMPTVRCPCGYRGLPIQLTLKEYMEWVNGRDIEEIEGEEGIDEKN